MLNEAKGETAARESDGEGFRVSAPSISLPKGGGAIKGIGEKFSANPVTGTGSLSIPLPLSPGRSAFTPPLTLSYDSGSANGPYGFGWSIGHGHITRRTDRGLPQYRDAQDSDVYLIADAEDLVPVLRSDGTRFEELRDGFRITRYRPRTEGLFARIERWSQLGDLSGTFWRSISRDNVTTTYGKTAASRIADPADASRIFTWLISESFDDRGNAAVYHYVAEDDRNIDISLACESNRPSGSRAANRYLKRVRYGNRTSRLVQPDLAQIEWLFELVLDYGDHDRATPTVAPTISWPVRPDAFSSHRAGFEIRTYRRCGRVLMFHRFQELGPEPKLVRSLSLDYDDLSYGQGVETRDELEHPGSTRIGSFLRRATLTGYAENGFAKSMPPLELTYSRPRISSEARPLDEASAANLPAGVDGLQYQWVDLEGAGISSILSEQAGAWWYKPNLGEGHLGPQQLVSQRPSSGVGPRTQFLDLAGDGNLDLVQLERPNAGFFERDESDWLPFRPFTSQPNIAWDDPNLRFVDLTGDGHMDVLITEDDVISWLPSLGEEGFGPRERLKMPPDESLGPKLVFNDGTRTIFLADMTGDGLSDLVRIRNEEICYWPNLGYGRFGRKVTMDNAPTFEAPELFESRRIRLADIDGSGVVDIIYLAGDGVRLYFNLSGNSWSSAYHLANFPPIDQVASVSTVDLFGNGTACLVWSTPLTNGLRTPLYYVDLTGGQKPHLLVGVENNLGARTVIQYSASTRFYLEDERAGRPWITRLPFPVHVVERLETHDDISRNRFVTRFAYHHGSFDGVEREFRGFGMVERYDTEEFAALAADQQLSPATNLDAASHMPPVLTRTWFHTGYFGAERISNFFAGLLDSRDVGEYYREPGSDDAAARELLLDDTVLPPATLTAEEEREACRALKGSMLRQEIYALDGTSKEPHPYSVTEQNYTIRLLQPRTGNPHAVFLSHPRESIRYHYERTPADPSIAHTLTLEVDEFGNVLKSASVAYGRRQPDPALPPRDQQKQAELHITYAENFVTNAIDDRDDHRLPLAFESRSYELTGLVLPPTRSRFSLDELLSAATGASEIAYDQASSSGALQKRLIEQERKLYRRNTLSGALPLGLMESLAIPLESYRLAFTPSIVANVYGARVTDNMLADEGRYVHSEGDDRWWSPSGRIFFSAAPADDAPAELSQGRQHFFLPRRYKDPFGQTNTVSYDHYDLMLARAQDALGNLVTVGERDGAGDLLVSAHDYRVLQPRVITEPNGNRAAVSFDALGMVVGTAVMGKRDETPSRGDLLEGFVADLPDDVIAAHLADPLADPHAILQRATTRLVYDLLAYYRTRQQPRPAPSVVYALVRETHEADLAAGEPTNIQHSFSYSDGVGREIQKKVQAEAGPVPQRDPATGRILIVDGVPQLTTESVSPRWVGDGWTVFNNKGKPVRKFEPFFTDIHRFESDVRVGVSPVIFYDPLGRVVATLHPDHAWEKVVFDSWRHETWDVNDTILIADPRIDADVGNFFRRLPEHEYQPSWHAQRQAGELGPDQQAAAIKAAVHAATPTVVYADSLMRTFLTIVRNRFKRSGGPPAEEAYATRATFDIEGNQREMIDARDRVVMRYDYDMLGTRIHQTSMEAGERWMLSNSAASPIYTWDSRQHRFRSTYDVLRRPTDTFLRAGADPEILLERTVYGESAPAPEGSNQRGKAIRLFDQAGVVFTEHYDFKGNLLSSRRQLAQEYKATLDWSANVPLETEVFTTTSRFDALNRPIEQTAPDASRIRHSFNEANLLERVEANLRDEAATTIFVGNIHYDAKGRRALVEYGNGVTTTYTYDPLTSRLTRLLTTREPGLFPDDCPASPPAAWPGCQVQDLHYTYDPSGNIVRIRDRSQQTIFFRNRRVEPSNDYTYDSIYRLIEAAGREHLGQSGGQPNAPSAPDPFDAFSTRLEHRGDGNAMGTYLERYFYDEADNILSLQHRGSDPSHPGWSRIYAYDEASQIEPGKRSNRLSSTTIGMRTDAYRYDGAVGMHGNITAVPHLTLMQWNHCDQLRASSRQATVEGMPETTWYVYDAGGQRSRKITERMNGTRKSERSYIAGFEIYREYGADGEALVLERESLHVLDDRQRIALVESRTHGDDGSPARLVRFQFGNHILSASLELDERAKIISYEEYGPFGNTSYQAVRSQTDAPKRYRFGAMERDEENGMEYHSARYYLPWLGRWLSADPIGLRGGINLYSYCRNSPIMLTDSGGSSPDDVTLMYGASIRKADKRKTYFDEEGGALYVDASDYFTPISARLKKHGDAPTEFEYQLVNDFNEDKIRSYQLITDAQGKIYGYRVSRAQVGQGRYRGEGSGEYYSATFNRDGAFIEGRMFSPNNGAAVSVMSPIDFIAGGIVAGAATKLLLGLAPKATTVGIGWIVGTNTGEAISGETSGINPTRLVGGDTSVGKKLSAGDRITSLVTAATFALAVPRGAYLEPPSPFRTLSDEEMLAARGAGPRRGLDAAETQARDAAVAELRRSHSPQLAGTAFHDAMGAARRGVDLPRHGGAFQLELKTHYTTSLSEGQISSASAQSFGYSQNYQLTTGLVPIRQVRHYMINPRVHGSGIRIDSH